MLRREGANPRVCGLFYKAVVLSSLLYASETWLITQPILRALEGFHNQITQSIAKMSFCYLPDADTWVRPPIELARERAGIYPVQRYLNRRHGYLVRHARNLPLLWDCVALEGVDAPSTPRRKYWWHDINLGEPSGASSAEDASI